MSSGADAVLPHVAWLNPADHQRLMEVLTSAKQGTGQHDDLQDARLELAVATVRERMCPAPSRIVRATLEQPDAIEVRFTVDELDALDLLPLPTDLRRHLRGC